MVWLMLDKVIEYSCPSMKKTATKYRYEMHSKVTWNPLLYEGYVHSFRQPIACIVECLVELNVQHSNP
uniref:MADF domain-containing protein n=1 Tax=Mesocestoides corti TaxID=53468 RepID=A0A5K3FTX5_MESCO